MMHIGPPRVLIVEDDPDTLVIMRVNLRAAGIEPILASDGSTVDPANRCRAARRGDPGCALAGDRRVGGPRDAP